MGDVKVEDLVKKIQMNDPKVGKVAKSIGEIWSRGVHETRSGCDAGRSW